MEDNYKEKLEMKIKKISLVIVMISNIFVCLFINFSEVLSGVPIGNKSILVSICYLLVWATIILIANHLKSKKLLKLFLGFWVFNLLLYFLVNILLRLEVYISFLVIMVVIFIGPMQGLLYSNSDIILIIIDALISSLILYFIKKTP